MNTKVRLKPAGDDLLPEPDRIVLVILNIYATTSKHLYAFLSEGANISTPDPAYESALELFEDTRLGGSVIWINAEGVTLDELAQLEKQWLPAAGKAIMLMGSNQVPVINRSLQGLMAARRENQAFEAVVLTPEDSIAATTCRLMASQSGGWLRHDVKDMSNPQASIAKVMKLLALQPPATETPETPDTPVAPLRPAPQASAMIIEPPSAAPDIMLQEEPQGTTDDRDTAVIESPSSTNNFEGTPTMAKINDSMNACLQIDGAMAAALVDMGSGMALAKVGGGVNLDMAAAGNTEVLKAKLKTMASLGIQDSIEDVLITLGKQYHLIRPIPHKQGLFLYLVLDKTKGNLAMARFKLMEIEKSITV
jgi:hypothetical protein